MTFKQAAVAYFDQNEKKWGNKKHRDQFLSSMEMYVFGKIGALAVADIDVGQVLKCIEPHWHAKAETMSRVRNRIEAVLDWCAVRGYRAGDNPARWTGHLDQVLPARGKIAKTVHMPAARTGEVIGARWDEIDLEQKLWVVPAARMKARREHRVPFITAGD
jgi:integrase